MAELFVHEACNAGKLKYLTDLIEAGADPNEVDGATGSLPLHWAARSCRFECAEYVVKNKLNDLNAKNKDGNTPLHYATISGSKKITALLLENGADINAINKNGQTPLHGAVSQSWDHVVEYLGSFRKADCKECKKNKCSKHMLDVNAQDKNGQTALHMAGDLWSNTVYEMLQKLGGVETIKDDRGDFPKSSKVKWWEFISQTTPVLALLLAILVSYLYYRWDDLQELSL